jgi:hypothetical protein
MNAQTAESLEARKAWLRKAILSISAEMRGPLPNIERALLHQDRKDFRAELARLEAASPAQEGR